MPKRKCTGLNCPIRGRSVDPKNCSCTDICYYVSRPTNADAIRAMTDEELSRFLCKVIGTNDPQVYEKNLRVLKAPAGSEVSAP